MGSLVALTLTKDLNAAFGGQIKAAAGSSSVPSFSFAADPDSGITSAGANALAIVTGGVDAWYVLSNGQLQNAIASNQTTGVGTALLGSNSPAVTNTNPFTWLKITLNDGSQGYIPIWK